MDPDLFILPDLARHADSQPGAGAQCHGCASRQGTRGRRALALLGALPGILFLRALLAGASQDRSAALLCRAVPWLGA